MLNTNERPAALARLSEQRRSDAAYTRALAAQLALQFQRARLIAQRNARPRSERLDAELARMSPADVDALRLRMARRQGSAADYALHARLVARRPNLALADASGCTEPGREHFDSRTDYLMARNER